MDALPSGSLSPSKGKAASVVSPQEINAQPQDFVVVNGQTFRVSRSSPRSYSLGSSLDAGMSIGSGDGAVDTGAVTSSMQFKKQLEQADKIIMKQAKKIEELELLLRINNIAIASPNTSQENLANRRRAEARNIQTNIVDSDIYAVGNAIIKSPQKSTYITPTNAETVRESKYSSFSAPNSTKNIDNPNIYDSPEGYDESNTNSSASNNSKEPPKGLAARLAMGSQERRKIAAAKRLKSLPKGTPTSMNNDPGVTIDTSTPVALLRSNSSPSLTQVLFKWKGEQKGVLRRSLSSPTMNSMKNTVVPPFLFIAHDNPQLGSTVASQLAIDSSGMNIMLESKDDLGLTKFLLARIIFSGDVECVEDAELSAPRGSQFIVCHDIKAVKGDIKAFPTRVKGDILEIGLGNMPHDFYVDISSDGKLKEYLQTCTSRVDVILDPSGSDMWYPYFEGRRKMAPQFRSKGIGYIRLGDDMSRYGIAFLTLDAGHTYLDDGATSIVSPAITDSTKATPTSITPSYGSSSNLALYNPNLLKGEKLQFVTDSESEYANSSATNNRSRSNSSIRSGSGSSSRRSSRPNSSNFYQNMPAEARSPREIEECKELITRLKDGSNGTDGGALKWSDRAEYLKRLANNMAIKDSTYITDAISIAFLSMTKQKNPHVVRAAVQMVKVIGESPYIHINNSVAWRSLLVETIQLLRGSSKPIYDDAVYVLTYLHSIGCFTIGSLTVILDDVFGSKKNSVSTSASNSSKIISLLDSFCRFEIEFNIRRVLEKSPSPTNTDFDRIDSNNILQRVKHLLQHREEATRDTAVTLVAVILVYHIVTYIEDSGNPALLRVLHTKLSDEQSHGRVNSSTSLVVGKYFSANINNFLTDIDKANPRLYEKIMVELTSTFISLVNSATIEGPLGNTGTSTGTVTSITSDILYESSKGKRDGFSPLTIREREHAVTPTSASKPRVNVHHNDDSDKYSLDELSNSWYELRLILRIIPNTEAGWRQLATCVKEAPDFFALLSTTAKKNNVAQGSLLRVVLPFDEDTSSNDQAQVRNGLSPSLQKISAGYQNIDEQTMSKLREQAVMLRKLIRVKMADEADLQQAIVATRMLIKFCDDVDNISALANTKPVNIIKSLDTNSPLSSM